MSQRLIVRVIAPFSYEESSRGKRKTRRYREGQTVVCHGMPGFSHLRELANQNGGIVELKD